MGFISNIKCGLGFHSRHFACGPCRDSGEWPHWSELPDIKEHPFEGRCKCPICGANSPNNHKGETSICTECGAQPR